MIEPGEDHGEEPDLDPPGPNRPGLLGRLPRLPVSTPQPRPSPPPAEDPTLPAGEGTPPPTPGPPPEALSERSSPASTDRAVRADPELVPPKELKEALRQAADVCFVLAGQGVGAVVSRARRNEKIAAQWVPTKAERELVLEPTGRIIARHVTGTTETADVIDAALIAAGLGAFTVRASFGLETIAQGDTQ